MLGKQEARVLSRFITRGLDDERCRCQSADMSEKDRVSYLGDSRLASLGRLPEGQAKGDILELLS